MWDMRTSRMAAGSHMLTSFQPTRTNLPVGMISSLSDYHGDRKQGVMVFAHVTMAA